MRSFRFLPLGLVPFLMGILVVALWAGLVRLGWPWPLPEAAWSARHGILMVPVFFGGLIALERAVALRHRWTYLAPLFHLLGGLFLLTTKGTIFGRTFLLAGAVVFLLLLGLIMKRHPAPYTMVMALAAGALAVGDVLWAVGWPVPRVVLWWSAFLVLTIAGERLELGRLLRLPQMAFRIFQAAVGITLVGLLTLFLLVDAGVRLVGLGFLTLALWLLRYDVARHTVRRTGFPRFVAWCLLIGYAWLAVGGAWMLAAGFVPAGPSYDAMLHAILVGFVFSMVFGHAPIIFPAFLGRTSVYHPRLYLPLIGLHGSLVVRVLGDAFTLPLWQRWGGLGNAAFILLYFLVLVPLMRKAHASFSPEV